MYWNGSGPRWAVRVILKMLCIQLLRERGGGGRIQSSKLQACGKFNLKFPNVFENYIFYEGCKKLPVCESQKRVKCWTDAVVGVPRTWLEWCILWSNNNNNNKCQVNEYFIARHQAAKLAICEFVGRAKATATAAATAKATAAAAATAKATEIGFPLCALVDSMAATGAPKCVPEFRSPFGQKLSKNWWCRWFQRASRPESHEDYWIFISGSRALFVCYQRSHPTCSPAATGWVTWQPITNVAPYADSIFYIIFCRWENRMRQALANHRVLLQNLTKCL